MEQQRILGIDPGLSGAVAVLVDNQLEWVANIPTLALMRGGKAKRDPDLVNLGQIIGGWAALGIDAAFIEQVSSMPGQGVSSVFAFGKVYGGILGILAAHSIPTHTVIPGTWRKAIGLKVGTAKDASRAKAIQLWPAHAASFARVKDDGRAEAALIGLYGVRIRSIGEGA